MPPVSAPIAAAAGIGKSASRLQKGGLCVVATAIWCGLVQHKNSRSDFLYSAVDRAGHA